MLRPITYICLLLIAPLTIMLFVSIFSDAQEDPVPTELPTQTLFPETTLEPVIETIVPDPTLTPSEIPPTTIETTAINDPTSTSIPENNETLVPVTQEITVTPTATNSHSPIFSLKSPIPSAFLYDNDISISWTDSSDVDFYRLVIKSRKTQKVIRHTFKTDEYICSDGVCQANLLSLGIKLPRNQAYDWWMIMRRGEERKQTAVQRFRISAVGHPIGFVLKNPLPLAIISTPDTQFVWGEALGVTRYVLQLFDAQNNLIYRQPIEPSASCEANVCSIGLASMNIKLTPNQTYSWRVKVWLGNKSFMTPQRSFTFNLMDILLTPEDGASLDTDEVFFTWKEVLGAEFYRLVILDADNKSITRERVENDSINCSDGICKTSISSKQYRSIQQQTLRWHVVAIVNGKVYRSISHSLTSPAIRGNVQYSILRDQSPESMNQRFQYQLVKFIQDFQPDENSSGNDGFPSDYYIKELDYEASGSPTVGVVNLDVFNLGDLVGYNQHVLMASTGEVGTDLSIRAEFLIPVGSNVTKLSWEYGAYMIDFYDGHPRDEHQVSITIEFTDGTSLVDICTYHTRQTQIPCRTAIEEASLKNAYKLIIEHKVLQYDSDEGRDTAIKFIYIDNVIATTSAHGSTACDEIVSLFAGNNYIEDASSIYKSILHNNHITGEAKAKREACLRLYEDIIFAVIYHELGLDSKVDLSDPDPKKHVYDYPTMIINLGEIDRLKNCLYKPTYSNNNATERVLGEDDLAPFRISTSTPTLEPPACNLFPQTLTMPEKQSFDLTQGEYSYNIYYLFARAVINGLTETGGRGSDPMRYFGFNFSETFRKDGPFMNMLSPYTGFCDNQSSHQFSILFKDKRDVNGNSVTHEFCSNPLWYGEGIERSGDVELKKWRTWLLPIIHKAIEDEALFDTADNANDPVLGARGARPVNRKWISTCKAPTVKLGPYTFVTYVNTVLKHPNQRWSNEATCGYYPWHNQASNLSAIGDSTRFYTPKELLDENIACSNQSVSETLPQSYQRHLSEIYGNTTYLEYLNGVNPPELDSINKVRFGLSKTEEGLVQPGVYVHALIATSSSATPSNAANIAALTWNTYRFDRVIKRPVHPQIGYPVLRDTTKPQYSEFITMQQDTPISPSYCP